MQQLARPTRGAAALVGVVVLTMLPGCIGQASVEILEARSSEDGLTLELVVGSCNAELTYDVRYEDESVAVIVHNGGVDVFSDGCADVLTVTLDEPLGSRELIDASTSETLAVTPIPAP